MLGKCIRAVLAVAAGAVLLSAAVVNGAAEPRSKKGKSPGNFPPGFAVGAFPSSAAEPGSRGYKEPRQEPVGPANGETAAQARQLGHHLVHRLRLGRGGRPLQPSSGLLDARRSPRRAPAGPPAGLAAHPPGALGREHKKRAPGPEGAWGLLLYLIGSPKFVTRWRRSRRR